MSLIDGLFFISFSFLDKRKGGKRKSRHQGCRPSCPGTSKIFDLPLPENMNMRHVSVYPCRGVLHTPYRYPIRGKRKAFDDQMCKMIFGPKGRLWGVCNTPLPENMNMRRVWVYPCRGVSHTPFRRSIYGTMSHDN